MAPTLRPCNGSVKERSGGFPRLFFQFFHTIEDWNALHGKPQFRNATQAVCKTCDENEPACQLFRFPLRRPPAIHHCSRECTPAIVSSSLADVPRPLASRGRAPGRFPPQWHTGDSCGHPCPPVFSVGVPPCRSGLPPSAPASVRGLRSVGRLSRLRRPPGLLTLRCPQRHPCRPSSAPRVRAAGRADAARAAPRGALLGFCVPRTPGILPPLAHRVGPPCGRPLLPALPSPVYSQACTSRLAAARGRTARKRVRRRRRSRSKLNRTC